jgi:hypothetical protein
VKEITAIHAGLVSFETVCRQLGLEPSLPTRTIHPAKKAGPKNAYIGRDGLRFYPWEGEQLISVTSLRQQVGLPPGLVVWMQKQVAERAIQNIGDLTKQVFDVSIPNDDIVKWLLKGPTETRDAAGAKGSAIHAHVAAGGGVMDAALELRPYVSNYEIAMSNEGIEPLLVEKQVFSPSQGYAGSFDLIGRKDGEVTLIDLKTGGGLYLDNALQLAGYVLADFVAQDGVIDHAATELLHSVTRLGLLHVTDMNYQYVDIPMTQRLGDAFRAQLTLAQFYASYPNLEALTTEVA